MRMSLKMVLICILKHSDLIFKKIHSNMNGLKILILCKAEVIEKVQQYKI